MKEIKLVFYKKLFLEIINFFEMQRSVFFCIFLMFHNQKF